MTISRKAPGHKTSTKRGKRNPAGVKIQVYLDGGSSEECPFNNEEKDGWRLDSFLARQKIDENGAARAIEGVDGFGDLVFTREGFGLSRSIAAGTAFVLSCYIHGNYAWSLQTNARGFDTTEIAGVLWLPKDVCKNKTYKERADLAKDYIRDVLNPYWNGEIYTAVLVDQDGEILDSITGLYPSGLENVHGYFYNIPASTPVEEKI